MGPLETLRVEDFQRAMAVMFWGTVYTTLEALPHMRARQAGHIVNITSVGGKMSVPHLLPYSAAKFAAVGFSEGLHAEQASAGIHVLTVVPGLMRTGPPVHAEFKGRHRQEFAWFGLAASLPITSIAADDAARQIVSMRRGDAEIILTWQAAIAARVHGLMPGLSSDVLALVNRFLPRADSGGRQAHFEYESRNAVTDSALMVLGENAALISISAAILPVGEKPLLWAERPICGGIWDSLRCASVPRPAVDLVAAERTTSPE